jgi:hypothetical protein
MEDDASRCRLPAAPLLAAQDWHSTFADSLEDLRRHA